MKRRWAVLWWSSLACLVGFTLVAARLGLRTLDIIGVHMIGMVLAAILAFSAMVSATRQKWPAVLAAIATTPMSSVALLAFLGQSWILAVLGAAGVLTFAASLCSSVVALVVAVLPPPPEDPRDLAKARVVDEARPRSEGG